MNTVRMGTEVVAARSAAQVFNNAQLVPGAAAAIVLGLFVFVASQTANPLAYLVGMSPIAWIATEGVWRLFR